MYKAQKLRYLGTETAFAVGAEAASLAATGFRVYPFHLGDLNLRTPQNIVDSTRQALEEGKTGYAPTSGILALRQALAEDINMTHRTSYRANNVIIQPGGKPVITKFLQCVMNPGDEVLYPNPGYPIYESQIEYLRGVGVPYSFKAGPKGFELDFDQLSRSITPRTRILIFNDQQNPTGFETDELQRQKLVALCEKHDLYVLLDEAYFDIRYSGKSKSLVEYPGMDQRTVILYTFSKKFAMTGWRLGAAIGPADIMESISLLNVNDESCSNHFIQYGAIEGLKSEETTRYTAEMIATLKERRDVLVKLLGEIDGVSCYVPECSFYLFPNVTKIMKRKGFTEYEPFRRAALHATGVSFTTRAHFGRPGPDEKEMYVRFAYSGINVDDIREGMTKFKAWAQA